MGAAVRLVNPDRSPGPGGCMAKHCVEKLESDKAREREAETG